MAQSQPRSFQFYGAAYGNSPATLTASINGTQVFSGTVPTLPGPFPVLPDHSWPTPAEQTVLFTIDDNGDLNTNFAGSLPMSVTLNTGDGVIMQNIYSNWYRGNVLADSNVGTSTGFKYASGYITGPSMDQRSNVVINGVAQNPPAHTGSYAWDIAAGETIEYSWNLGIGEIQNTSNIAKSAPGNTANYSGSYAAFIIPEQPT